MSINWLLRGGAMCFRQIAGEKEQEPWAGIVFIITTQQNIKLATNEPRNNAQVTRTDDGALVVWGIFYIYGI